MSGIPPNPSLFPLHMPLVAFAMCGRFNLRTSRAELVQLFLPGVPTDQAVVDSSGHAAAEGTERVGSDAFAPRYNIAPTQPICCVLPADARGPRHLALLRWGLIPSWAKELSIGNRMINARAETVREKPSFRRAFASRRCLIPASGYYEWKATSSGKQPYLIRRPGHALFAMAGLWETNRQVTDDGSPITSCTIVTTSANQANRAIHDRMPVVLQADAYDAWLDPTADLDELEGLLKPAPDDLLQAEPVSRRVNNPRNDSPECVEPVALDE